MLVKEHLQKNTSYFPYLYSSSHTKGLLSSNFYDELKFTTDDLFSNKNLQLDHGGQEYRTNITLKTLNKNLQSLRQINHPLAQLFDILNSQEIRLYLYHQFKSHLMTNGFIGKPISAFLESTLELQYCEASASYENPFHVDTRKRVVHGLLYMGQDNLEGGNLLLAKHKGKKNNEYPQIPDLDDLIDFTSIEPKDNTGLLILSTPNSYHKGQCSIGRRRFCYWGYNYMNNNNCWVSSPSWDNPLKFKEAVALQNSKVTPNKSGSTGLKALPKDNSEKSFDSGHETLKIIIRELEERVNLLNDQLLGVYSQLEAGDGHA